MRGHPVLLPDEPTAALDRANRDVVPALVGEAVTAGTAVAGIFHDAVARARAATRKLEMAALEPAA